MDAKSPSLEIAHPGSAPGVVAASVYANGQRVAADIAIDDAREWSKRPGHVVWIGLFEPDYDLLAQVPLFADLPPAALSEVAQSVQVRQWAAGATVVEEGAAGDSFFLVLKGEIEVEVGTRPRLGVGDFFGELSLLFGRLRSATVRAVVETELAEMHRQDFETLLKQHPNILIAGQLSGVEGYTESIASGLLAGRFAAALARGETPAPAPRLTANGSLTHYITHAEGKHFQPANITFDLLVPLEDDLRRKIRDKKERHRIQCERALTAWNEWLEKSVALV